jgi:hypothetical protein
MIMENLMEEVWIIKQWILKKSGNTHNAFNLENQLLIIGHAIGH